MSLTKSAGLLAGTAALSLAGGSLAGTGAEADRNSDLEARLAAAEAKIAQLTDSQGSEWLTEQRSSEIRSLVQDVLADADTRASLLTQGVTAGYDNGAVLSSADGNWMVRVNGLLQSRWVYSEIDEGTDDDDEGRAGFENPRIKLSFSGHVVDPSWFYKITHNFTDRGNDGFRDGTLEAYIGHDYGNGTKIALGAMKAPVLREELVGGGHQLAVERSVLNYATTAGYQNGIKVAHEADQWRAAFMFSNGVDDFFNGQGSALEEDTEYAISIRGEFLISGMWEQFRDFTSPQGSEQGIMIGVAYYDQSDEDGDSSDSDDYTIFTVDGSIEGDGWNAFAAYIQADDDDDTGTDFDVDGFIIQGGIYLNETWELYARWEDADWDSTNEDLSIFTVGVNKYFAGHNAKWSTDIGIASDSVQSGGFNGAPLEVTGYRSEDGDDEDGQMVIRTQLQIAF